MFNTSDQEGASGRKSISNKEKTASEREAKTRSELVSKMLGEKSSLSL